MLTSGLRTPTRRSPRDRRARGQIIVIFAGAAIAFMALSAIVIDVSWYWSSQVKMQRAADAAALAGVVRLPGDVPGAQTLARTEASRNGYTQGVNGMSVTPIQDAQSTRRMQVTIAGPINTFFARIVGLGSFPAQVISKAQYILPVPMGSPENYYGVFGLTRGLTSTTTTTTTNRPLSNEDSGSTPTHRPPTSSPASGGPAAWTTTSGNLVNAVNTQNTTYAQSNTDLALQQWGGFTLDNGLAGNQNIMQVYGIQVQLNDAHVSATLCTTSVFRVALSFDNGASWTTNNAVTGSLPTSTTSGDYSFGSSSNAVAFWTGGGTPNIANSQFRVRITADKVGTCAGSTQLRLDDLRVRAWYQIETVTTSTNTVTSPITDVNLKGPSTACSGGVADCFNSDGSVLNPRGFWGTMNTQGAANVNGDAHQPYYDTAGGTVAPACNVAPSGSACYDPNEYYNYAIEMPQGATNGSVYIYDPAFCSVVESKGTGDRWFSNNNAVTSTYELWDTQNTLYDRGDDGPLNDGTAPDATSGALFRGMKASDTTMGGDTPSGYSECMYHTDSTYGDGRDYHNKWWRLYTGMTGGATGPKIYRVHTTSTDPAFPTEQQAADGENSFAIYASATGGTPKIYGLGAMQAFTPLSASGTTVTSEFYLAQIEKVHATKTIEIALWDAGDTYPLLAELEILIPNGGGWTATPVTYSATLGTTASGRADGGSGRPDCRALNRTTASTSPIVTYVANSTHVGNFNGCWLTIRAVIPGTYNADQQGWWKIRYRMNGTGTSNDVTTWKVQILGNPVHLIVN